MGREDDPKFIKQQLKISALKDAMNKFFKQMELNSDVFWQLLIEKSTDLGKKTNNKKLSLLGRKSLKSSQLETEYRRYKLNYYSKFLESEGFTIVF